MAINIQKQQKEEGNQYNQPCKLHAHQCTLFCPHKDCMHFLCPQCEDPHYTSGIVLHATQIRTLLRGRQKAKQAGEIAQYIEKAQNEYGKALTAITNNFQSVVNSLARHTTQEEALDLKAHMNTESIGIIEVLEDAKSSKEALELEIMHDRLILANSLCGIKEIVNIIYEKCSSQ